MKKTILLVSISFFAIFSVFGQKSTLHNEILQAKEANLRFENIVLTGANAEMNLLTQFINPNEVYFFTYNFSDIKNNEVKAMNLVLPLNNKSITLELVEAPDYFYEYNIITDDGERFPANRDIKHYRGIVENNFNSVVAITFCEDEMIGLVCTDEGNFNIVIDSLSGKHIFYNESNLKEKTYSVHHPPIDNNFVPYDPEVLSKERTIFSKDGKIVIDPGLNKIVKVYVETRYNVYIRHGSSVDNVEKHILALFNQVSTLFLNEDIHLGVLCLCMHRSNDPYPYNGDAELMLQKFQEETKTLKGADLGILLSYRKPHEGYACVDGLCKPLVSDKLAAANIPKKEYKDVPTYSTSVHVVTHELGHLLGSNETYHCVWNNNCSPLDGCNYPDLDMPFLYFSPCNDCYFPPDFIVYPPNGGTIMSYCHLSGRPGVKFSLGFGDQPGNVIRRSVINADCLQCLTPENITNQTITTDKTIIGCVNLNFQNVIVSNGATVNIIAGERVTLKPNFHATSGTNVHISIYSSSKGDALPQSNMFLTKYETTSEETNSQNLVTNNINSPTFTLYPNPNPGTFQIETNFPLSAIGNLKITNLLGATVYETQNVASNMVQLQNPAAGTFFVVMVLKDGAVLTRKMVIQK